MKAIAAEARFHAAHRARRDRRRRRTELDADRHHRRRRASSAATCACGCASSAMPTSSASRGRRRDTELVDALSQADFVFHLAGVNRPQGRSPSSRPATPDFTRTHLRGARSRPAGRAPVVFSSSTQAALDNPYGRSKRAAEDALLRYAAGDRRARPSSSACPTCSANGPARTTTRRSRPSATTSRAACRSRVNDPAAALRLVYIDDVVAAFLGTARRRQAPTGGSPRPSPVYETTVGEAGRRSCRFRRQPRDARRRRASATGLRARALRDLCQLSCRRSSFAYDAARSTATRAACSPRC